MIVDDEPLAVERLQIVCAGLDGVVAKSLGKPYAPNARQMLKIKHARTADVVVAGYRLHKTSTDERPLLGSLLLGLYADDGTLQHVGVAASFTETRRAELVELLQPLVVDTSQHPWGQWQDADVAGRFHAPEHTEYGLREFAYVDPDGNLWRVGSPLA